MDLFNIGFNVDSRQVAAGSAALRTFAAEAVKVERSVRESVGKINAAFKSIKPSVPMPQIQAAVRAETVARVRGVRDVAGATMRAHREVERSARQAILSEVTFRRKWEQALREQERRNRPPPNPNRPDQRGFGEIGILRARNILLGAAIFSTIQLGRALLTTSDIVKGMESRLRLVTKSQAEYNRVTEQLAGISRRNLIGLNEASNLYVKIMGGLKGVAGATTIALAVTDSFSAALRVGGANTREASAAAIQFAQAIGSGVLRGDEFRSLAEASPVLLQNMADGLGVTRGALKSMADDGLLTANMAIGALLKTAVRAEIQSIGFGNTISGAGVQIQNSFIGMVAGIERTTGAFSGIASMGRGVASMLDMVVPALEAVKRAVVALAPALVGLTAAMGTFFIFANQGVILTTFAAGFTAIRLAIVGVSTAIAGGGLVALLSNPALIPVLAALTALAAVTSVAASQMGNSDALDQKPRSQTADDYLKDLRERVAAARELGKVQSKADLDELDRKAQLRKQIEALRQAYKALNANDEQQFEIRKELKNLEEALTAEGKRRITLGEIEAAQAKAREEAAKRALEIAKMHAEISERIRTGMRTNALRQGGMSSNDAGELASLESSLISVGTRGLTGAVRANAQREAIQNAEQFAEALREVRKEMEALDKADKFMETNILQLGEGFDTASNAMFNFVNGFGRLIELQDEYTNAIANGKDVEQARLKLSALQIDTFASMAGAAKGFFKESSTGYKALLAAEQTFRAFQLGMSIAAMIQGKAETASAITDSNAKAVASGSAGIAKAFEQMGVYGFIGAAAIVAALATAGVRVGGGKGGGGSVGPDLSKGQGTTQGDMMAQSESIAKSVEITASASEKLVGINYAMLQSLRALERGSAQIGTNFGRQDVRFPTRPFTIGDRPPEGIDTGGVLNLVEGVVGSLIVSIGALFGAGDKTFSAVFGGDQTTTGQGLQIPTGTFADLLSRETINIFTEVFTEGGWFEHSSTDTYISALDAATSEIILGAFDNIAATVTQGALALGMTQADITAAFGAISIPEFRVDMRGTDEDRNKAINTWLSGVLDTVALATIPALDELALAGETWAETLSRLVLEVTVLNDVFSALGVPMKATIEFADSLAAAFGGVANMTDEFSTFIDLFFSDQEKVDLLGSQLGKGFAALGVEEMPVTKDAFRAMVDAALAVGDPQLVAGLLAMQEPLAEFIDTTGDIAEAAARAAAKLAEARDEFVRTFDTPENVRARDTARLRTDFAAIEGLPDILPATRAELMALFNLFPGAQDALAALTPQLDAYYEVIEEGEAQRIADMRAMVEASRRAAAEIRKFIDNLLIGDLSVLTPEQKIAEARSQFIDLARRAQGGDLEAAGQLTGSAQSLLTLGREFFASSQPYQEMFKFVTDTLGATAGILDSRTPEQIALDAMVLEMTTANETLLRIYQQLGGVAANDIAGTPSTNVLSFSNSEVVTELRGLRSDMAAQSDTVNIKVVTPNGDEIANETLTLLKDRSRREVVIYASGVG